MQTVTNIIPSLQSIEQAASNLNGVVKTTPFERNERYSTRFDCDVYFKREDVQSVRSYKIRGAYNMISSIPKVERERGVVCASAGNHAQGVAWSCNKLKVHGTIFMPTTTPSQKIEQVKMFGNGYVDIRLEGDTYDDSSEIAQLEAKRNQTVFVHPFDDEKVIQGQATVGLEILQQCSAPLDYVFVPIGGGGLAAGLSSLFKHISPETKIIGVEPEGAAAMRHSMDRGENTTLESIDKFVDGAAVHRVGELNFSICKELLYELIVVPEGMTCLSLLELYNRDAIIVEPAGALSVAALETFKDTIKGKQVACIISGGNNDITRTAEIKERALLYSNLKHYFIVRFPQRAGALRQFVATILGPDDDISHFEYTKKTNRENGVAVVGIELKSSKDLEPLVTRMKRHNFYGDYLNDKPELFQFLV